MIDEIDIWLAADLLLRKYGPEASFLVAERADARLALGELYGLTAWLRIGAAIAELERMTPREGEAMN